MILMTVKNMQKKHTRSYIKKSLFYPIQSQWSNFGQWGFMSEKTDSISVDKVREFESSLSSNCTEIEYKVLYPDKDKNSLYETLRNEFGYWMTFKSIGWRTEEFLLKRIT